MGCYNNDVLFIHIPKCGGWSVKKYLEANLPGMMMPDNPEARLPIGHVRLQDIERFTDRKPESFKLIFAVIRNPYEQQLSQWCFWRDRYARGGRHVHDCVAASYATLEDWLQDSRCDFHVWYEQHYGYRSGMTTQEQTAAFRVRENQATPITYHAAGGYYRYWLTVRGEIPINVSIFKLEKLNEELPSWLRSPEFCPPQPPPILQLNTSPHRPDVQTYYTPRAAQLVEHKFPWAFEKHYQKWLFSEMV